MKTYTLTMTVYEGNDEFWEDMDKLSVRDAKEKLKQALLADLQSYGWLYLKIKMGKVDKD